MWSAYHFFGHIAIEQIIYTVLTAVLTEALMQILLRKRITILDGSAAVTGILLAISLPPHVPLWMGPLGAVITIALVKQAFGGLGGNFMNPALAARALLSLSWPMQMTSFVRPYDAVASATPLAIAVSKDSLHAVPTTIQLFLGEVAGCLGETSVLALMIGGIILIFFEVIDYRVPVGILGTVFALSSLFAGPDYSLGFSLTFGFYQLLSGGVMLASFFMATDYVTSPVTRRGRLIYSVAVGVLIVLIRFWGQYPEGVTFAILLMNIATPLIERITMPRMYGEVTRDAR